MLKLYMICRHEITEPKLNIDYYGSDICEGFAHRSSWATFNITEDSCQTAMFEKLEAKMLDVGLFAL